MGEGRGVTTRNTGVESPGIKTIGTICQAVREILQRFIPVRR